MEKDPNGKNPHELGAKLDSGKAPVYRGLLDYFPRALEAVSHVSRAGAAKYAWKGWETVDDGYNRYQDALGRHQLKKAVEGPIDSELLERGERILHDAQIAWNALAALELYLRNTNAQQLQRTGGRDYGEAGFISQRVSESSAKDTPPNERRDLRGVGLVGGSGGSGGALCQSQTQAIAGGYRHVEKGTG